MTTGLAADVANDILDALRDGGATLTVVTGKEIQLHTGDPGAAGTSNVSVGSSTKVAVTEAAPAAGSMAANGTLPQWTNGGTTETISHLSVWDGATFKYSLPVVTPKEWADGQTITLASLVTSLTPIAA